jgi:Peptidase inhibitor I78 family
VYHSGDMLTMDFSETRLNIELDAQNRVVRAHCG